MAFRLIPREEKFFDDFVALAEQIQKGAGTLAEMLAPERPCVQGRRLKGSSTVRFPTHQIKRPRTFVAARSRTSTLALDDVMDAIDASAAFIRLYQIPSVRPGARELARIIRQSAEQVVRAMKALGGRSGVTEAAVEINRLENEADRAHMDALRTLFDQERDPVTIMKWKEILDFLEDATDRCEDVANVLEGVVVKHA